MEEIIMRNFDLGEFHERVNLPSPIQQVRVPIRRVITPIQGLPNPIRQVVPRIPHIRLYPPYRSHHHPPSLSLLSTTLPSLQNTKLSHLSLSLHVMIMSWHRVQHIPSTRIHRVQHTPSTASTGDCLSSHHSDDYELTPECTFSLRRASLHDRPPSASSPWELKVQVTLSHSHGCELTNWWIESQHPARHPSTASKYSSKLVRLRPPSTHDHGLQVHPQTRSVTASKCISKLARLRPPSASPNSLDYGRQVHLQTHSITASKFARSSPPCASPHSLVHDLGVHL